MPIDVDVLQAERDRLKEGLRELEIEQRKVESDLKALRQKEIRTKRELDALSTLIEMNEGKKAGAEEETGEPEA